MKLITRETDYALRALCFIFQHKRKKFSVSMLVKELKVPKPFLRKILQVLNKRGILKSSKGRGGGFQAAKRADKVFLADLIEAFQGPLKLNECFFKKLACPNIKACVLRKKIDRMENYIIKELRSISVASLLR